MNKKFYFLIAIIFAMQGCNNSNVTNSDSDIKQSSNEDVSSSFIDSSNESKSETISSSEAKSSSEATSSSEENSSSEEISSSEESSSHSREDDYNKYKNKVDRSKITYTTPLVNDENHKVRSLEIFQINDTHGAYIDGDEVGISRVKTCISENTNDIYAQVKIANGDMMQGSAFSNMLVGEPAVAALNEMNFDCFVIGNHEFDWGFEKLRDYKDNDLSNGELNCPFLGANIVDKNNNRPDFIEPYTIVNKGDMKVGIIGIIGDGLENSISKTLLNGYHFTSSADAVKKYSEELLSKDVDTIIVASHAHDEGFNEKYASNLKVDCIINAHDHQDVDYSILRNDGKSIPVIESRTKNLTLGKVVLNYDDNKNYLNYASSHFYPSNYDEDATLKNIMEVYYEVVKDYQDEVIGYKKGGFSKKEIAISTCTYIQNKYDVDLVFVNTGGVRTNIENSSITNGHIYSVFPFDNELYLSYIKGSELKRMISYDNIGNYYYNDSSIGLGTTYDINNIDTTKTYKVMTVDYVATKNYMEIYFNAAHNYLKTGIYVRDEAINCIKENYKLSN